MSKEKAKLAALLIEHGHTKEAMEILEGLTEATNSPRKADKQAGGKKYFWLDPQLGVRLHEWHAGQADPIYEVGSLIYAGRKVKRSHLQEAVDGLEYIYETDKKYRKEKSRRALDRKSRHILEELIDELNGYLRGQIEDESYAFEEDEGEDY